MKEFFRRLSPKQAVRDFAGQWQQPTPHRWQIMGVAMAATFAILMVFIPESQRVDPAPPDVIYISTFDESRSEAEIIASNCANHQLKEQLQARLAEREELRKDLYRSLGRATFVDVEAMEREIAAEQPAESESEGPDAEALALSVEEYCARAAGG